MKYLKYFQDRAKYEEFINSDSYVLPNVILIEEEGEEGTGDVEFNYAPTVTPAKLTLKYNSTEDNLLAFTSGRKNIKKLVVDGNNIEFEPVVETETSSDVLSSEITINMNDGTATFPDSYLLDSVPSTLTIRPKDDSIKIGGSVCLLMLGKMGEDTMCMPADQETAEAQGLVTFDTKNNVIVATDSFLGEYDLIIQEGALYGFGLCNVDENEGTISVVDAVVSCGNITGGVPVPYYFDTAGQHTVEMTFNKTDIDVPYMFVDVASGIQAPLTSVEISEDTTSIGNFVFIGCTVTGELVIPDSVNSIGQYAFASCEGLTKVTIGSGVTSIEEGAFYNCYGLTGELVIPDSVTSIGEYAFDTCSGLTEVTIGSGVTEIGSYAFGGCSGLTSITIPDSVTSIGTYVFYSCSGLTSVTIGSGVTSIGDYAFYNCSGLTGITIPDSVSSIGLHVFYGCSGLTEITCHALVAPSIQSSTFQNVKSFGVLNYPEGSDYSSWLSTDSYYLGYYYWNVEQPVLTAKYNVTSTTESTQLCQFTDDFTGITIDGEPMDLMSTGYTFPTIGEHTVEFKLNSLNVGNSGAFRNCSGLTEVTIGSGVTSIGNSAFDSCSGLTGITIPDSVTSIGTSAFNSCSGLTSISIPDSVTSIGGSAFFKCSGLTGITIPDSVTKINNQTFEGCSGLTEVTIGSGVTEINLWAFQNCKSLSLITIPNSVTRIGQYVFHWCSGLTKVTIGSGVTSIEEGAFAGCSGITEITCHAMAAPSIQSTTFQDVKSNGVLYVPGGSTESYSTWMSIGDYYLGKYNWTIQEMS